jgi:hypothetical protein
MHPPPPIRHQSQDPAALRTQIHSLQQRLIKAKAAFAEEKVRLEDEMSNLRASHTRELANSHHQKSMLAGSLAEVKAARESALTAAKRADADAAVARERTAEARRQATLVEEQAADALRRAAAQAASALESQRATAAAQAQLEQDRRSLVASKAELLAQLQDLTAEVGDVQDELERSQAAAAAAEQRAEEYSQLTLELCDQLEAARVQAASLRGALDAMELAIEELRWELAEAGAEREGAVEALAQHTRLLAAADAAAAAEKAEAAAMVAALREQLAAATALVQHERDNAARAAAEAAERIGGLERGAESGARRFRQLEAEAGQLRAALSSLEALDHHRAGVFDLVSVELAELTHAGVELAQKGPPPLAAPRAAAAGNTRRRSH